MDTGFHRPTSIHVFVGSGHANTAFSVNTTPSTSASVSRTPRGILVRPMAVDSNTPPLALLALELEPMGPCVQLLSVEECVLED